MLPLCLADFLLEFDLNEAFDYNLSFEGSDKRSEDADAAEFLDSFLSGFVCFLSATSMLTLAMTISSFFSSSTSSSAMIFFMPELTLGDLLLSLTGPMLWLLPAPST